MLNVKFDRIYFTGSLKIAMAAFCLFSSTWIYYFLDLIPDYHVL